MLEFFFPFIFFGFIAFILFGSFTRKGRDLSIKMNFGVESVEDLGLIDEDRSIGLTGKQKIRVIKCYKNQQPLYLLEISRSHFGGFVVYWVPFDKAVVQKLASLVK